ncbi:MAG TPA: hypothetical protein VJ103_02155 [Candidatus Paceibacterota bacterium]|nr:hypothetical protein [Candidatus Paceibacterota bacterium]
MGKVKIVLFLGVLNILVPFLGLPSAWKTALFILIGLSLIALAYSLREAKKQNAGEIKTGSSSDSYPG